MAGNTQDQIYDFLSKRRLAMIGLSSKDKDFSRLLFAEFLDRGYEMIGVHPEPDGFTGLPVVGSIKEIQPPVEGVILMTPPNLNDGLIRECIDAGIKQIWVYGLSGSEYADNALVEECRGKNINLVANFCPFMFFPHTGFIHRFHGGIMKLIGRYPK
jgi:predicted CoA-binding protein